TSRQTPCRSASTHVFADRSPPLPGGSRQVAEPASDVDGPSGGDEPARLHYHIGRDNGSRCGRKRVSRNPLAAPGLNRQGTTDVSGEVLVESEPAPTPQGALAGGSYLRDPDVQLMLRVREGVDAAFARLVAGYQDRLVGLLSHLTGERDAAE